MNKQICLFVTNISHWKQVFKMMHLHKLHTSNYSLGILTLFISCFLQVYQLLLETENQNKVDKAKKRQKHLVNLSTICYEVSNVIKD